jgi:hypothetical protein
VEFSIGRNENMQTKGFIFLATLAVSVGGGISLGAGIAQADEVLPGLTCNQDAFFGVTTCTNTTNTDYTVFQTRECEGGAYSVPGYFGGLDSNGNPIMTTTMSYVDPSVEQSTIFVPAHNTGLGLESCAISAMRVHYSVEPPPAVPPPPPLQ